MAGGRLSSTLAPAQPASQQIIAHNNANGTDITLRISGAGQQRIEADDSCVERVVMDIT